MDILRNFLVDILGKRKSKTSSRPNSKEIVLPTSATIIIWQADGKLGDAAINSLLVENVYRWRPDLNVIVVTRGAAAKFWNMTRHVSLIVNLEEDIKDSSIGARRYFDLRRRMIGLVEDKCEIALFISFDSTISIETLIALNTLNPRQAVGFGVELFGVFTHSIADQSVTQPYRHVSTRIQSLLEVLGMDFEVCQVLQQVFVESGRDGERCFFNTFGASTDRTLSWDSVFWITEQLYSTSKFDYIELSIDPTRRESFCQVLAQRPLPPNVRVTYGCVDIETLITVIGQCSVVVTTDTAAGHLGALFSSHVIVFFTDRSYKPLVWHPLTEYLLKILPAKDGLVDSFNKPATSESIYQFVLNATKH